MMLRKKLRKNYLVEHCTEEDLANNITGQIGWKGFKSQVYIDQ